MFNGEQNIFVFNNFFKSIFFLFRTSLAKFQLSKNFNLNFRELLNERMTCLCCTIQSSLFYVIINGVTRI